MSVVVKKDIDVEKVMEVIGKQFKSIMYADESYYDAFNIVLTNEQQIPKKKDYTANTIYIVVKFMSATLNFGQIILPITINAIGERNKIEVCQRLLMEYAQTFNLTEPTIVSNIAKQVYSSPTIMSNFNDLASGYNSLFYMSGTFLLTNNNNSVKSLSIDSVDIDFITASDSFDAQLDPKVFYDTGNFTKSVSKVATYTINITSYLFDNDFFNKINAIKFRIASNVGIQNDFAITMTMKNDQVMTGNFKLVNSSMSQNVGELAITSLTFTN